MKKGIVKKVYNTLDNKIELADKVKIEKGLIKDPGKNFSRKRKLYFKDVVRLLIFTSGAPVKEELFKYYEYSVDTASDVAFIKARSKIKAEAFEYLNKEINKAFIPSKTYKGYQLVGVDGCDLAISFDPKDDYTYYYLGEGKKACSIFHLNVAYDILNHRYLDNIIQGVKDKDEPKAMYQMAERSSYNKQIYIADRMYPTLNNMEHLRNNGKMFAIRVKKTDSKVSFFNKFNLPDGEFDEDVRITLTSKQTKEVKTHPDKYRYVSPSQNFDYLSKDEPYYEVSYRIVRFKIPGSDNYETLVTNLLRVEFSIKDLQYLYKLRWGHEVSYRHLKYSENLCALHSRNRELIRQEIWAKIILYNICMIIIDSLNDEAIRKRVKYECAINITLSSHIIRDTFRKRKGGIPPGIENLIIKQLLPIRPDRKFERKLKPHSAVCFNYRFS